MLQGRSTSLNIEVSCTKTFATALFQSNTVFERLSCKFPTYNEILDRIKLIHRLHKYLKEQLAKVHEEKL